MTLRFSNCWSLLLEAHFIPEHVSAAHMFRKVFLCVCVSVRLSVCLCVSTGTRNREISVSIFEERNFLRAWVSFKRQLRRANGQFHWRVHYEQNIMKLHFSHAFYVTGCRMKKF